jgi:hypothetical protein
MATLKLRTGSTTPTANVFVASEPGWDGTNNVLWVKNAAGAMAPVGTVTYSSISSFPATGISNAIYIAADTGKAYAWFSTAYGELGASGALPSLAMEVATVTAGAVTLSPGDIYSGTILVTLTQATTITLPSAATSRRFNLYVAQDATGSWTPTFTSTSTIVWPNGVQPSWCIAASTFAILSFISNGTAWYAHVSMDPTTRCDIVSWM